MSTFRNRVPSSSESRGILWVNKMPIFLKQSPKTSGWNTRSTTRTRRSPRSGWRATSKASIRSHKSSSPGKSYRRFYFFLLKPNAKIKCLLVPFKALGNSDSVFPPFNLIFKSVWTPIKCEWQYILEGINNSSWHRLVNFNTTAIAHYQGQTYFCYFLVKLCNFCPAALKCSNLDSWKYFNKSHVQFS